MEQISWLDPVAGQVFATTRWSIVKACGQENEAQAQEALAELCQAYWRPVYACIRHHGHSTHDAEDLAQEFFVHLLGRKCFEHLNQAKGRFRAYLSVALQNFLRDHWRRRWTLRRGRGVSIISMDVQVAERDYNPAPATLVTPESLYERQWARLVVEHAFEQLKIELMADHKEILLEHFDAVLAGNTGDFPYVKVAAALQLSVAALHATLHRWRRRYRVLMREEIARTVVSKSEIEDELRHLQRVFALKR